MADQYTTRKWTFLVYLAGDNNLETYGYEDLNEMKKVGSTDQVAVVAQFDCMADQITRRYYLTTDGNLDEDCIAQLPEVNTGDPNALLMFINWACQKYPAERYALVLWNHGAGWKDDDIYRIAQKRGVQNKVTRGQIRGLASGKDSRALFNTTLDHLVLEAAETERAILFDDSSQDFLDSTELRQVLARAVQHIGHPLDILGFDACLMNMLEVHYQVRNMCRVVVGSQEVEPGDGWPYNEVLTPLVENPRINSKRLGKVIVDAYVRFYQDNYPNLPVTQSAVTVANIESVANAVNTLGRALMNSLSDRASLGLLFGALRSAQTFTDRDYIDLAHFCQLLTAGNATGEIGKAAYEVNKLLNGNISPVIAEAHHGREVANASGLSIYLPVRILSPLYKRLEFAQQYHWDEFLQALIQPK